MLFQIPGRGADRFISLMEEFGLMDRFVWDPNELGTFDNEMKLDYTKVNEILNNERKKSMAWLEKCFKFQEKASFSGNKKPAVIPV